ncbi:DUF4190 domain-containing protein [Herbiconiux sp. L3-i23]|uniref:DUF4190 domain-containing protein n=1 Tax=Herbiconiux sp. L3-i23 TaxID=2905871 RepID=UPI002046B3D1|nr:DUF4190 domain-containing protein [Herbiconiux sp. L3-i23]BDI23831.1 hypothetical protein L3i23_26070 [Herbiconiux sp. L3-i23]
MTDPGYSAQPTSYSSAPAPAPWNVLSIVAFVLSLLGFTVVAIILGHIGLSQIKKTGQQGRGFGIAALIIGYVTLVLGIIAVAIIVPLIIASAQYAPTSY